MPDQDDSLSAPNSAASPEVSDLTIINGGIDIEAVKIDGTSEKVKVRQLPIVLTGQWGRNQGSENEAYLIELLCDKVDRTTAYHLMNSRLAEMRVQAILQQASFEQLEAIQKRLHAIREEIARHEAKPRWSDELTHESVEIIRALGERLNKKKFVDQTMRVAASAKTLLETMEPPASPSSTSSSPSPTSAESQSGT